MYLHRNSELLLETYRRVWHWCAELACTPQDSQLCALLPNTVLGNLTLVALKLAAVGEFIPWKLTNIANQDFVSLENSY